MFEAYPPYVDAGAPGADHEVEPELRADGSRLPRPAAYTPGAIAARGLWVILIVGVAAVMLTMARGDVRELAALRDGGRVVAGRIIDRYATTGKNTSYHLVYDYVVDRRYYDGDFKVSRVRYDAARVGDELEVAYLPAAPAMHRVGLVDEARVRGQYRRWLAGIFGGVGVLTVIATLLELDRRKHLHLLTEGFVAVGAVIDHREVRGSATAYYLTYRFSTPDGEGVSKKVRVPKPVYDRYASGDGRLTVLYDPRSPAACSVPYAILRHARLVRPGL